MVIVFINVHRFIFEYFFYDDDDDDVLTLNLFQVHGAQTSFSCFRAA